MNIKRKKIFIAALSLFVLLAFLGVYYAGLTTKGSLALVSTVLSRYVQEENSAEAFISGSLFRGMVFEDLKLAGMKGLPPGNSLRVRDLKVSLNPLAIDNYLIEVNNGRLNLPDAEPVLFYGTYGIKDMDIEIYCRALNLPRVLGYFTEFSALGEVSGTIADTELHLKGSLSKLEVSGSLTAETLSRNGFSLHNAPGKFDIKVENVTNAPKLNGYATLEKGRLRGPRTATVDLKESRILFEPQLMRSRLDVAASSNVGGTVINISVKGVLEDPEIRLTSTPHVPEEQLLLMLATDQSWRSIESAQDGEVSSSDIAKDLFNYFVLSGRSDAFYEKYGIRDLTLIHNEDATGMGVTKDVTERASVGYTIEKVSPEEHDASLRHGVKTDYKLGDDFIFSTRTELERTDRSMQEEKRNDLDYEVRLKMKKRF